MTFSDFFIVFTDEETDEEKRISIDADLFSEILSRNSIKPFWDGKCISEDGQILSFIEASFVISGKIRHRTIEEQD